MDDTTPDVTTGIPAGSVDGALHLARLGYSVFPCLPYTQSDGRVNKPPARGVMWHRQSTTSEEVIRSWWNRWPTAHPAIDCGKSGIVVIDVDPRHGGTWDAPGGYRTLAGGRHVPYREAGRHVIGCDNTGKVAQGVDVKGMGGYVVCWAPDGVTVGPRELPAVPERVQRAMSPEKVTQSEPTGSSPTAESHRNPAGITRGDDSSPSEVSPEKMTQSEPTGSSPTAESHRNLGIARVDPFTTPERAFTPEEAAEYVRREALDVLRAAPEGQRNHTLNRAAMVCGHFVPAFWTAEHMTAGLAQVARAVGLQEREIGPTIRSGLTAGQREPYVLRNPPESSPESPDAVESLLAEMVDTEGLDAIGDLQPLIKRWLSRNTVARINGRSTHGKSFVALDMAAHVATGRPWRGHRVHQGTVVYCVAEGVEGFRKRVRAWERHHETTMTGVRFLPRPVQVKGPEWGTFLAACRRLEPVLIVLDTQARVTVGVNENDNAEMGVVVEQAEALRRETGACVLFVHHLGHNGEEGRGATAVKGAMQTELLVQRDEQRVSISLPKQKDDSDSAKIEFSMSVLELWADEDGDPVTSCVLVDPEILKPEIDPFEDSKTPALEKLVSLFMPPGPFAVGNGATKAEARSIAALRGMPKTTFYDTWNEMLERRMLARVEGSQSYRYVPSDQR